MSSYSSGRRRSKMPPPHYNIEHKTLFVDQIVWVKVKGHQIWPGTVSFFEKFYKALREIFSDIGTTSRLRSWGKRKIRGKLL